MKVDNQDIIKYSDNQVGRMRLTAFQQQAVIECFRRFFYEEDHIWLFGSRVDDTLRGGDIDLYIETLEDDFGEILEKKLKFLVALVQLIGEQKIDVLIKSPNKHLPIHDVARSTGVLLA